MQDKNIEENLVQEGHKIKVKFEANLQDVIPRGLLTRPKYCNHNDRHGAGCHSNAPCWDRDACEHFHQT